MITLFGKNAVLNETGKRVAKRMIDDITDYGQTSICPYWSTYLGSNKNDCAICNHFFPKIIKSDSGMEKCPCHNENYTAGELISVLNELLQQSSELPNDSI